MRGERCRAERQQESERVVNGRQRGDVGELNTSRGLAQIGMAGKAGNFVSAQLDGYRRLRSGDVDDATAGKRQGQPPACTIMKVQAYQITCSTYLARDKYIRALGGRASDIVVTAR